MKNLPAFSFEKVLNFCLQSLIFDDKSLNARDYRSNIDLDKLTVRQEIQLTLEYSVFFLSPA